MKCLEKDPSRRYPSAQALAEELGRYLAGEPIHARPAGPVERLAKWARRRPAEATLLGVILAALTTVSAMGRHEVLRSRAAVIAINDEKIEAKKSEGKAKESEALAIDARKSAERRLVRSALANGNRLVADGDPLLALPWYVHALKHEPDGPQAEHRHRIRLAAALDAAPRLARLEVGAPAPAPAVVSVPEPAPIKVGPPAPLSLLAPRPATQIVKHRSTSADGKRVLTTSGSHLDGTRRAPEGRRGGMAIVSDAATGEPVFPPLMFPHRVVNGAFLDGGRRFLTVMEIEEDSPRGTRRRDREITTEIRAWSSETGEPTGEPVAIPLAGVRVELNASGDRLLLRGHHARLTISFGAAECQVRDVEGLRSILPRPGEVASAARFSPDGRLVAALVSPEERDPKTLKKVNTGEVPTIVTAARLYGSADGEPLAFALNHDLAVDDLEFSPDGREVVTTGGGQVRLWESATGRLLAPGVQGHSFLEYSPDGSFILMRTSEGAPQVWRLDRARARLIPSSPPLPAAGWSQTIRPTPMDRRSGGKTPPGVLDFAPPALQFAARFAPDGRRVVITSTNRLAHATETRDWSVTDLPGFADPTLEPPAPGRPAGWHPPARPRGDRYSVVRWFPADISMVVGDSAIQMAFAPGGQTFLRFNPNRFFNKASTLPAAPAFRLYANDDGRRLGTGPSTVQVVMPSFGPGGRHVLLVTVLADIAMANTFQLLKVSGPVGVPQRLEFRALGLPDLRPVGKGVDLDGPIGVFALSPDGRHLAVTCGGSSTPKSRVGPGLLRLDEIRVYELETGRAAPGTFRLPGAGPAVAALVDELLFSPNGRRLLVRPTIRNYPFYGEAVEERPSYLLDAETLQPAAPPLLIPRSAPASLDAHGSSATGVYEGEHLAEFSPDGRLVVVADHGNVVGVFDTVTGRSPALTPGHPGQVQWVRFSPDGRRLATTGSEGTARLWDTATGSAVGPPMLQDDVRFADFSRDGLLLITAGPKGMVRGWDGESAEPILPPLVFPVGVKATVFSPDSRKAYLNLSAGHLSWAVPDLPAADRPAEVLEAYSIALSGHVIDGGEGLSPATPERVKAARAFLAKHDPGFFEPTPPPSPTGGTHARAPK